METIFNETYILLKRVSSFTGFTYTEINIIIWFILIPLSWMLLLDKIYKRNTFTITFCGILVTSLLLFPDFPKLSVWLFQKSVDFLNFFNTFGSNYITTSVIICIVIPTTIYVILIRKAFFSKSN